MLKLTTPPNKLVVELTTKPWMTYCHIEDLQNLNLRYVCNKINGLPCFSCEIGLPRIKRWFLQYKDIDGGKSIIDIGSVFFRLFQQMLNKYHPNEHKVQIDIKRNEICFLNKRILCANEQYLDKSQQTNDLMNSFIFQDFELDHQINKNVYVVDHQYSDCKNYDSCCQKIISYSGNIWIYKTPKIV